MYYDYLQDNWNEWLIEAEAVHNGHPNESTTVSPFYATNGFEPRNPFDLQIHKPLPPAERNIQKERTRAEQFAVKIRDINQFCKEQITLAQSRMAEYANNSRQLSPNYQPGDIV